jgi:WD40 repeat protein
MRLCFANTGEQSMLLGPFSEILHSFQFSENGMLILLCCGDGSCHIFCGRSGVLFLSIRSPSDPSRQSSIVSSVPAHACFSPDCRQIALLLGGSSTVHLLNLQSSRLRSPRSMNERCASALFLCWSIVRCFSSRALLRQASSPAADKRK